MHWLCWYQCNVTGSAIGQKDQKKIISDDKVDSKKHFCWLGNAKSAQQHCLPHWIPQSIPNPQFVKHFQNPQKQLTLIFTISALAEEQNSRSKEKWFLKAEEAIRQVQGRQSLGKKIIEPKTEALLQERESWLLTTRSEEMSSDKVSWGKKILPSLFAALSEDRWL